MRTFTKSAYGQRRNSGTQPSRFGGKKKQPKPVDPSLFVKKAIPQSEVAYTPGRSISELPVDERIVANLLRKGYKVPTEIQDRSLEALLSGKDLLGIAKTGTGKTGAFLVPIVHRLLGTRPDFQVLVIVPTRELAVQIEEEFKWITKALHLTGACFIGGTNVRTDLQTLRQPYHVVIGTPGRLTDLAQQGALRFNRFEVLVLDEFDRLLDMGFSHDILRIVDSMTKRQQTVLLSATEDKTQRQLVSTLLTDPAEVRVSSGKATADHVEQATITVKEGENKQDILIRMLKDSAFNKVLVFAETKRAVSKLARNLQSAGIKVDQIHGNKSQNYRIKALRDFKNGTIQALIATDVAARGLDITEVTHVINYQPPKDIDSYIHRIGRTGRAGKTGKALTFLN